jgi:hypothetical protein
MDIVDQAESKVQPGGTELFAKGETKLTIQPGEGIMTKHVIDNCWHVQSQMSACRETSHRHK